MTADWAQVLVECCALIIASGALFYTHMQYISHKQKEDNKLLSQLNKRYTENDDIQVVVRYLRVIDPDKNVPRPFQTELFLRFFEELGVYLRNGSLPVEDVKNFFNFYLEQMYTTDKGKDLLAQIRNEEKKWPYLNDYKDAVGFNVG